MCVCVCVCVYVCVCMRARVCSSVYVYLRVVVFEGFLSQCATQHCVFVFVCLFVCGGGGGVQGTGIAKR